MNMIHQPELKEISYKTISTEKFIFEFTKEEAEILHALTGSIGGVGTPKHVNDFGYACFMQLSKYLGGYEIKYKITIDDNNPSIFLVKSK